MPLNYDRQLEPANGVYRIAVGMHSGEIVIVLIKPAFANTVQRLRHGQSLRDYSLGLSQARSFGCV